MDPRRGSVYDLQKFMRGCMLKIMSFLQFHIAYNNEHTPIRICPAILGSTPSSHNPNNVLILDGGLTLKAT
jgi:hypothetical protein